MTSLSNAISIFVKYSTTLKYRFDKEKRKKWWYFNQVLHENVTDQNYNSCIIRKVIKIFFNWLYSDLFVQSMLGVFEIWKINIFHNFIKCQNSCFSTIHKFDIRHTSDMILLCGERYFIRLSNDTKHENVLRLINE